MNLPNTLTLLRIVLVPVMVILLLYREFNIALILFAVAGITDALDGFFARVLGQQTLAGRLLDPLADKMLLVSSFITLSILGIIPAWVTVIVISRDFIITTGVVLIFIFSEGIEIAPSYISKLTTFVQIVTIFVVLLNAAYQVIAWLNMPLFYLTLLVTVISCLHYMYKGFDCLTSELE